MMKRFFAMLLLAATLLPAAAAPGQDSADEEHPAIKLVLHPAAEPSPALKYQLLPTLLDRRPGNAAVLYNKIPAERAPFFADGALREKVSNWQQAPLADLRQEEASKVLSQFGWVVRDLDWAGRCEYCDWQLPVREGNFFAIRLAEANQLRNFARILASYARWQIAQGKYDEAVRTLRSGYAMARYAGQGPTIVHGLIGGTIAGVTSKQVEQLIQQPDAPNLYWALSSLPRPLVSVRLGFEAEMDALYLSLPELRELDKKSYPPEQWRQLLDQTPEKFDELVSLVGEKPLSAPKRLRALAAMLEGYPRAKRFLIERGHSAADVEAMPVPQVILLFTMQTYDEIRDEVFKWIFLPYPEARQGMQRAQAMLRHSHATGREIIPFADLLLPATFSARTAEVRVERDLAALRILEALRLYGAAHGRLPDRLKDISEVPVPPDPFQDEPFVYYRDGDTALLESHPARYPHYTLRYQIHFVPKGGKP